MPESSLTIFLSPKKVNYDLVPQSAVPVRWVYLGKQFHEKIRIEQELGPSFHGIDIARTHNDVADRIRKEFVDWIDELNLLNGTSMEWWCGAVSSRNVYRSDVFQFCCYIEILEMIWKDTATRPSFVIVESPALAESIRAWGIARGITVSIRGRWNSTTQRLGDYSMFFFRWANFVFTSLLRIFAARFLLRKKRITIPDSMGSILIHTYLHPTSISDTGVFSDRYFPFLYEFLEKRGKTVLVLPTYHGFRYNYFPLFSRIKTSSTRFIIPEQFLTISDFLYAYHVPIRLLFERYRFTPFRGSDYTGILQEDILKDKFEDLLDATLMFRLTGRLKEAGIVPERVIDWYENQAINKTLSAGIRYHIPNIPIIGAQFFLHYPNFLSLSPTEYEIAASVVPDRLLETSLYQCGMATMFAPDLDCAPCAALRYAHLFRNAKDPIPALHPSGKRILLLLASFDIDETLELLSQVEDILGTFDSDVRFLIKFHPDTEKEAILRHYHLGQWPAAIGIFSGTLSEALKTASIVISKSSSSIVEAAAQGIPVVFLGNQTKLNFNPLAGFELFGFSECYTTEELRIALHNYLAISSDEKERCRSEGQYLRDIFFTDVTEATMSPLVTD